MLKAYFIIAFIYATLKTINSDERIWLGMVGVFLTNFFLFPLSTIKDIVKFFGGKNE